MVLGIFYFQKYKGHGDGDEQNVMMSLGPDRPGQNAILCHFARLYTILSNRRKKKERFYPLLQSSLSIQPVVKSFQK